MEILMERALSHCGYEKIEEIGIKENVVQCFMDMVDYGVFGDLDCEMASDMIKNEEISIQNICKNLLKL